MQLSPAETYSLLLQKEGVGVTGPTGVDTLEVWISCAHIADTYGPC